MTQAKLDNILNFDGYSAKDISTGDELAQTRRAMHAASLGTVSEVLDPRPA